MRSFDAERTPPFTQTYLINRFAAVFSVQELSHDDAPTARSMPARGNTPGTCPSPCSALAGRTDRFRNPGRCPGLECGGAFSAGIKVVRIRIHEARWLAIYEMASRNSDRGYRIRINFRPAFI